MNNKDKKDLKETGLAENKDVFPPRGSSINIPNNLLYSSNEKVLKDIIEDKSKNIGSDLYKKK